MVKPTVGRCVWFWNHRPTSEHAQPQAATIAHVWGNRCINIGLLDPDGNAITNPPTSVTLVQDGDELPASGCYCTWPPHSGFTTCADVKIAA